MPNSCIRSFPLGTRDPGDPAITLRVYAHVITEQAATAAEIFATAVSKGVSKIA
ncbi:hypothetical protein ACFWY5_03800 [Nonomuraea sp. NPDC059007]|uniref:hypothetical protein n=1 Tax=Nonomuraea sp. NPDC059007 TaxID=3346692 RepID=UPI0036800EC5